MAVTITKPKAKVEADKPVVEVAETPDKMTLEQLADAYGSYEDQINAMMTNPIFAKFEQVKKELMGRLATEMEPADEAELAGTHWILDISACSKNPRKITDVMAISKFLGVETFAKIASVKLSDVDKYLNPEQIAKVVDTETGYGTSRKIQAKFVG